ncbi:S41 family peptidase [Ornithinimicrobium avium]|uniref:S41 family peptidase n=1 Tax=Ornithinimicrobium avium TaxID=2283195 RepID=UPI0013B44B12|nr:S41 family peptidase [Ornithinimicrobium avium]
MATTAPAGTFSVSVHAPKALEGTGDVTTADGRREYLETVAGWLGSNGLLVDLSSWAQDVDAAQRALSERNTLTVLRAEVAGLVSTAGGRHSHYLAPGDSGFTPAFRLPTVTTGHGISRVVLPEGGGADVEAYTRYARAGLDAIHRVKESTDCGWVIDLRDNGGGTSWSMLAAVAPLLPDGSLGGFRERDGTRLAVDHGPGWVSQDEDFRFVYDPQLDVDQPVAVLIDQRTASAAEAVTTAFHAQPDTQIIGQRTAGLATGNVSQALEDGARILLTTAWMVDVEGNRFPEGIQPGIVVPPRLGDTDSEDNPMVQAGEEWLRSVCSDDE